jgi:hypothetical protein
MKQCPTCKRTYADDGFTFCLDDGALLSAPYDPKSGKPVSTIRSSGPPPTAVLPDDPKPASRVQPPENVNQVRHFRQRFRVPMQVLSGARASQKRSRLFCRSSLLLFLTEKVQADLLHHCRLAAAASGWYLSLRFPLISMPGTHHCLFT